MEELTICYEFQFNVAIRRKKGKLQKSYAMLATGLGYSNAVWDMYFTLKKRQSALIRINSARIKGIAFALDEKGDFVKAKFADYPIQLPEDLNEDLDDFPKK